MFLRCVRVFAMNAFERELIASTIVNCVNTAKVASHLESSSCHIASQLFVVHATEMILKENHLIRMDCWNRQGSHRELGKKREE